MKTKIESQRLKLQKKKDIKLSQLTSLKDEVTAIDKEIKELDIIIDNYNKIEADALKALNKNNV